MRTATRDMARNFKPGTYLHTFFSEKRVPYKVFTVKDRQGLTHDIPNEVVVEYISQQSKRDQQQAADIIRKIDFKNGDVNHFLEHMAGAVADSYSGALRAASMGKSAYFTVVLPAGVSKWQSPRSTVTRGAFPSKREAEAWAKKNVPEVAYRVKQIEDVLPIKSAAIAKNIARWMDHDPARAAGYIYHMLIQWEWGGGNLAEDFGQLTRSLHGGRLPAPNLRELKHGLRSIYAGSPDEEISQMADLAEDILKGVGESGLASSAKALILRRMAGRMASRVARKYMEAGQWNPGETDHEAPEVNDEEEDPAGQSSLPGTEIPVAKIARLAARFPKGSPERKKLVALLRDRRDS